MGRHWKNVESYFGVDTILCWRPLPNSITNETEPILCERQNNTQNKAVPSQMPR